MLGSDGMEDARERIRLLDKLGDLACGVSAFPAAVKFYGKQVCQDSIIICSCV